MTNWNGCERYLKVTYRKLHEVTTETTKLRSQDNLPSDRNSNPGPSDYQNYIVALGIVFTNLVAKLQAQHDMNLYNKEYSTKMD